MHTETRIDNVAFDTGAVVVTLGLANGCQIIVLVSDSFYFHYNHENTNDDALP